MSIYYDIKFYKKFIIMKLFGIINSYVAKYGLIYEYLFV